VLLQTRCYQASNFVGAPNVITRSVSKKAYLVEILRPSPTIASSHNLQNANHQFFPLEMGERENIFSVLKIHVSMPDTQNMCICRVSGSALVLVWVRSVVFPGKIMTRRARPESATILERHQVCFWPPRRLIRSCWPGCQVSAIESHATQTSYDRSAVFLYDVILVFLATHVDTSSCEESG
jgi:hypothetical protein